MESYKSAVLARDVKRFMQLYSPNVRVFDAWGIWSYEGAESWQRAVEGWFGSVGASSVRVRFEQAQSTGSEDLACVSAIVTYDESSAQGEPLKSMQNRITWMLRTTGHVLRIVHEHTSAPIGFEDMKAILQMDK